MSWDRAQKVLIGLALVAGGIGSTLLYQTLNKPPEVPVKKVQTVHVVPPPAAPPAKAKQTKPQPK